MKGRIGIYRVGSLGDHLIALPLYRRIRRLHEQEELALICNIPAQANPKLIGPASVLPPALFDEFLHYPVGAGLRNIVTTYRVFKGARLDLLYYLMPSRSRPQIFRDRLFFALVGVPVIGLRADAARRIRSGYSTSMLYEHEADRLSRSIFASATTPISPASLSLDLTNDERSDAQSLLGGGTSLGCTVVLSIGTKLEVNDWGIDKWSQLVSKLAGDDRIQRLVLIGAADEFPYSEALRKRWPRASLNLCGRTSPRVSAAVIADAQLFVGHDSGPMHMAAAVNTPIVGIFSSRNLPGVWFPLSQNKRVHYATIECMGCGRLTCTDRKKECIRSISVNEVYASCADMLERARVVSF